MENITQPTLQLSVRERLSRSLRALSKREQQVFWASVIVFAVSSIGLLLQLNDRFLVEVPKHAGTHTEGIVGFPRQINPVLARTDADRDLSLLVYSGLLRKSPEGRYLPDLASSYAVSPDGLTYTIILKNNLKWHDGAPITSQDVAYTVAAIQDGSRETKSPRRASWIGITVTTPDPQTVVFTLPSPYGPFLEQLTVGILPAHIWSTLPAEQFDLSNFNTRPIGSGPYMIENIVERSDGIPDYYDLVAFPDFALGEPYIKNIRIRFYGNESDLLKGFEQGDVTAISEIPAALAKQLGDTPETHIVAAPLERVFAVYLNQSEQPIFQDKAVRKALEESMDRQGIVDAVLSGYGTAIDEPIPPSIFSLGMHATGSPAERIAEAQQILESGGWKQNADGIYQKVIKKSATTKETTQTLLFSISTGDTPDLKAAAESIAETWKKIGGVVDVKVFDKSTLAKDVIAPRKYDALFYGAVIDRLPDLLPFWHSSQRTDPGLNIALYANSKADRYLSDARSATTTEAQTTALHAFERELETDIPAIFVYSPSFIYAEKGGVHGISLGTLATRSERFGDIYEWYLKTERVWPAFTGNRPRLVTGTQ